MLELMEREKKIKEEEDKENERLRLLKEQQEKEEEARRLLELER